MHHCRGPKNLGFTGSVWFLAVISNHSVSAEMRVPPQTKQESKEQDPEQHINCQPEPTYCNLHYRGTHKPTRTAPRPIYLRHPYQREAPTGALRADDDIDIRRNITLLTAAYKPCEQCRHYSEECGALHKKQSLGTTCRFQYSDAPELMLLSLHCACSQLMTQ